MVKISQFALILLLGFVAVIAFSTVTASLSTKSVWALDIGLQQHYNETTQTAVILFPTTETTTATVQVTTSQTVVSTMLETLTNTVSTTTSFTSTSTSVAGVIGGIDPSMNTLILIITLLVGVGGGTLIGFVTHARHAVVGPTGGSSPGNELGVANQTASRSNTRHNNAPFEQSLTFLKELIHAWF